MYMLLHIQDDIVNKVTFTFFRFKMFFIVDEQGEIMIQAHAGEGEVVNAISKAKCIVNSIEQRNDIVVALDMQGMKMLLHDGHVVETGQHCSSKVDPVNAPWIIFVTSIGML